MPAAYGAPPLAKDTVVRYVYATTPGRKRIRMVVVNYSNSVYQLKDKDFPALTIHAHRNEIEPVLTPDDSTQPDATGPARAAAEVLTHPDIVDNAVRGLIAEGWRETPEGPHGMYRFTDR